MVFFSHFHKSVPAHSLSSFYSKNAEDLTIDNPGYPPQPEQDQQAHAIESILSGDVHNVQDEGNHHHNPIKHFKLVLEEVQAVGKDLPCQLHHEEGE